MHLVGAIGAPKTSGTNEMNTRHLRARDIEAHALTTLATQPDPTPPDLTAVADDRVANCEQPVNARSNRAILIPCVIAIIGVATVFAYIRFLASN
jgi:hypothetical protein